MPIPVTYETPELQSNESLKGFTDTDSLATAYLDLHGKVSGGSLDLLPEEMRKDPALAVFKTLPELAKGYVETKKMVGGIDKAPEKADGYKFTAMANLNPNLKSEGILNQMKGIFHKAGVGPKTADIIQQEILGVLSGGMTQSEQAKKDLALKNETALRQEWGGEFDKKFDSIVKVLTVAGGADAISETDAVAKAMKGSPVLLKALGKIVGMLSEDSLGSLGAGADQQITTKEAAQEEINKLNAEIIKDGKKHPYYDEKHAEHTKFHEQMKKLFELANS